MRHEIDGLDKELTVTQLAALEKAIDDSTCFELLHGPSRKVRALIYNERGQHTMCVGHLFNSDKEVGVAYCPHGDVPMKHKYVQTFKEFVEQIIRQDEYN